MKVTHIEDLNTFVNTVSSESRAEAAEWPLGVSGCLNNRRALFGSHNVCEKFRLFHQH